MEGRFFVLDRAHLVFDFHQCMKEIELGLGSIGTTGKGIWSCLLVQGISVWSSRASSLIKNSIGVIKAYTTRVGGGPFPTEQLNDIGEHFQTVGHGYGATTGQTRRCGWVDLVVVNYDNMINGYTTLNITKLDILDTLPVIKVAVGYILNGKRLETFSAELCVLEKIDVEYVELPGWQSDITKCREWNDLPENAKRYLEFIEKKTGVPVDWIGVGAARDEMVRKPLN